MNTLVIAVIEGDLQSFTFSRKTYAEEFVRKLVPAGYPAEIADPTPGDGELREILSEEMGPEAARIQMEVLALEDQYGDVFKSHQSLKDRVADARWSDGPESALTRTELERAIEAAAEQG